MEGLWRRNVCGGPFFDPLLNAQPYRRGSELGWAELWRDCGGTVEALWRICGGTMKDSGGTVAGLWRDCGGAMSVKAPFSTYLCTSSVERLWRDCGGTLEGLWRRNVCGGTFFGPLLNAQPYRRGSIDSPQNDVSCQIVVRMPIALATNLIGILIREFARF